MKSFKIELRSVKDEFTDSFDDAACLMNMDETDIPAIYGVKIKAFNPSEKSGGGLGKKKEGQ